MKYKSSKTCLCLFILTAALLFTQPAQANYWGFSPYGYNGSAFWPLRSVFYPVRSFGYGYGYGSGYNLAFSAPYLVSSLIGAAMYYPMYVRPYMNTQQYQDDEPISQPRNRVRAKRPSPTVADQNVSAQWMKPPSSANQPPSALPVSYSAPQPTSNNPPLAAGFINMVNSRFDGNIAQALFDPEGRSWARAIGIINNDDIFGANLSDERVALIKKVAHDPSADPAVKVQTIRILLQQ